jgi:antirestriction protein ArdC
MPSSALGRVVLGRDPVEQAEKLLQASGAKIEHSPTGGAYYNFSRDKIRLPSQDRFRTPSAYYATALHELGPGSTVTLGTHLVQQRTHGRNSGQR